MASLFDVCWLPPPTPKATVDAPQRWPELPFLSFFEPSGEEDALAATLPDFVHKVFRHAVALMGEDDAKALFVRTASKGRGKRGRGKNLAPNRDKFLLREYDLWRREIMRRGMEPRVLSRLPRILAGRLHRDQPGRYGASGQAIEWQLRRLIRDREKRRSAIERAGLASILTGYADY